MSLITKIKDAEANIEKLYNSGMDLDTQREILEMNSYAEGAHPASDEYAVAMVYERALPQFDADHPEIIEEIKAKKAEKAAKEHAYWESPEGVEKALSM